MSNDLFLLDKNINPILKKDAVLQKLSEKLTNEFGKGFSVDNLEKMRKFYIVYPNSETLSRKFKLVTLSRINQNR